MSNTQKTLLERIKWLECSSWGETAEIAKDAAAEIAQLQAENAALKAEIAEIKSRQITEHGTVEYGGVEWRVRSLVGIDGVHSIVSVGRGEGFAWNCIPEPANIPVQSGRCKTLFDAMQASIEYAKGEGK